MTRNEPDAPSDNDTLTAVLDAFVADGFDANFTITEQGTVRCPVCRQEHDPAQIQLERLRRMEGASDPADMLAVLALSCPICGAKGAAVAHFGPESTPGEVAVLRAVEDHRR